MQVMTNHDFFDEDIEKVLWEGHEDNREVVFKCGDIGAFVINKEDVIAFAKEFGLIVYERNSNL